MLANATRAIDKKHVSIHCAHLLKAMFLRKFHYRLKNHFGLLILLFPAVDNCMQRHTASDAIHHGFISGKTIVLRTICRKHE